MRAAALLNLSIKQCTGKVNNPDYDIENACVWKRMLPFFCHQIFAPGLRNGVHPSKQHTCRIRNRLRSMIILCMIIPTDLCDKQTVSFHGRICLVREAAGFRVGAGGAEAAAAGAQAERIRIVCTDQLGEGPKGFGVLFFGEFIALSVNAFFQLSYGLQEDSSGIAADPCLAFLQGAAFRRTGLVVAVCLAFVGGAHIPHCGHGL